MFQLTDEEILGHIKSSEAEFNTLAEIHMLLVDNNMICSIEEIRRMVGTLHRDGYLGNEPTVDGVNMYYIIYSPKQEKDSSTT